MPWKKSSLLSVGLSGKLGHAWIAPRTMHPLQVAELLLTRGVICGFATLVDVSECIALKAFKLAQLLWLFCGRSGKLKLLCHGHESCILMLTSPTFWMLILDPQAWRTCNTGVGATKSVCCTCLLTSSYLPPPAEKRLHCLQVPELEFFLCLCHCLSPCTSLSRFLSLDIAARACFSSLHSADIP